MKKIFLPLWVVVLCLLHLTPPARSATVVAAWGRNTNGVLGDGTELNRRVPVAITNSGALAGKTVVAVSASGMHSMALDSDGRVYAWGINHGGVFGNGTTSSSRVPVAVDTSGVLAGKKIVAISAGFYHSVALSSDGRVYTWGEGEYGQLGAGATRSSLVPVAVDMTGVLAGKTVKKINASNLTTLVIASDGRAYSWGDNHHGRVGDGTNINRPVPVAVNTSGVLAGKTITDISVGSDYSHVVTSDGRVYGWGHNEFGQLGDGTRVDTAVPVAVDMSGVLAGKTIVSVRAGSYQSLVLSSEGRVYSWGSNYEGELGTGETTPSRSIVPVAVKMTGALASKTVVAIETTGGFSAALASDGRLYTWGKNEIGFFEPDFGLLGINSTARFSAEPVAVDTSGILAGKSVTNFSLSSHTLAVASDDVVHIDRGAPAVAITSFKSGALLASLSSIGGITSDDIAVVRVDLLLQRKSDNKYWNGTAWVVASTTISTVLAGNNWGRSSGLPSGANLAAGNYFVAARAFDARDNTVLATSNFNVGAPRTDSSTAAWGLNSSGQLGTGRTASTSVPVSVEVSGTLGDPPFSSVSAGDRHSLALTPDGKVYAWGSNDSGQLGDGTLNNVVNPRLIASGALAGKRVVAISAGSSHSLALTSDNRLFAWGNNASGTLGNGVAGTDSVVPVAVDMSGALAGKTVTAISAGTDFNMVVASGRVYGWGRNDEGQIGDGSTSSKFVPTATDVSGVLAGKTVSAISAGSYHSLALTSDGRLFAWGSNNSGQLGNTDFNYANSTVAVAVSTRGALAGKTFSAVSTGFYHSVALASDGRVYTWGDNSFSQLGLGVGMRSSRGIPNPVEISGALAGKIVTGISGGGFHTLALASDGRVYSWGANFTGQLGEAGGSSGRAFPVAVDTSGVLLGKTVTAASADYGHSLALLSNSAPTDRRAPSISIATPTENASVRTLPFIGGAANDDLDVVRIDLYLQRRSDNKFWNGSTWTSSTALPTVLNGNFWSDDVALPSGANLAPGQYFIAARALDAKGNGTSATRNFNVLATDTAPPIIAIANPANNAILKTLPVISGTASDNAGVSRVDLYLQRRSDNKFWNGTTWTTSTPLSTVLEGFAPRRWSRSSGLPSGANLVSGLYFAAARAYDAAGNGTSATANFTIDTVLPSVAISSPTIGSTVNSFASASGTASDNTGVVKVGFYLRRNSDNKWWNGSAWVASLFELPTTLSPGSGFTNWSISSLLPKNSNLVDGTYLIGATAFDRAGNVRNVNGNFTLARPVAATAISPVQLSSASARADGTIRLTFTGALGANAGDAANYAVTQNEQAVLVASVSQPTQSTVEIRVPTERRADTPLQAGARVAVEYDIEDAQNRSIKGTATVVVK